MIALVELFVILAARWLGWALAGQLAGFLLLRKTGTPAGEALGMVLTFGGIGITILLLQLFPRNLSWLLGLPYSKRQLAWLHYGINAATVLMAAASQLMLAAAIGLVFFHGNETEGLWRALHELSARSFRGVSTLSAILVFALLGHLFCLSIFAPRTRPVSRAELRRIRFWLIGLAGAGFVAAQLGLARVFDQPIVPICLVVIALNVAPVDTLVRALAMSATQARRYRLAGATLAVLQCALLVGLSYYDLGSGDALRVAQAATLVGRWHRRIDDAALVRALEGDSSAWAIERVAELYREQNGQGLTIQGALRDKRSDGAALAALKALDPKELRAAELLPLFVWLDHRTERNHATQSALYWALPVALDGRQADAFLGSPSRSAREFVLYHARYARSPELIEIIASRLERLDPAEQRLATDSLAVLRGSAAGALGRAVASGFYAEPDCAGLKAAVAAKTDGAPGEGLINVCLRKEALELAPDRIYALESHGWLTWPLGDETRKLAKYLLSRDVKH